MKIEEFASVIERMSTSSMFQLPNTLLSPFLAVMAVRNT